MRSQSLRTQLAFDTAVLCANGVPRDGTVRNGLVFSSYKFHAAFKGLDIRDIKAMEDDVLARIDEGWLHPLQAVRDQNMRPHMAYSVENAESAGVDSRGWIIVHGGFDAYIPRAFASVDDAEQVLADMFLGKSVDADEALPASTTTEFLFQGQILRLIEDIPDNAGLDVPEVVIESFRSTRLLYDEFHREERHAEVDIPFATREQCSKLADTIFEGEKRHTRLSAWLRDEADKLELLVAGADFARDNRLPKTWREDMCVQERIEVEGRTAFVLRFRHAQSSFGDTWRKTVLEVVDAARPDLLPEVKKDHLPLAVIGHELVSGKTLAEALERAERCLRFKASCTRASARIKKATKYLVSQHEAGSGMFPKKRQNWNALPGPTDAIMASRY
jgi:hypothetical protein